MGLKAITLGLELPSKPIKNYKRQAQLDLEKNT